MRQYLRDHPDILVILSGALVLIALDFYVTSVGLRNAANADLARTVSESLGGLSKA